MGRELVDIVDERGNHIRTAEKSVAHAEGLPHPIVRIILLRNQYVYVQQRSPDKEKHPNRWEGAIAEHVHAGEHYLNAAIRGVYEECGIRANKRELTEICRFSVLKGTEHPAFSILYCIRGIKKEPQISSEAQRAKWMHIEDLTHDTIKNPYFYTPGFLEAWRLFRAQ